MEKKNTILLTIIAIATLLVAVVGATFAYFTAQRGDGAQADIKVTTSTSDSIIYGEFNPLMIKATQQNFNETDQHSQRGSTEGTITLTASDNVDRQDEADYCYTSTIKVSKNTFTYKPKDLETEPEAPATSDKPELILSISLDNGSGEYKEYTQQINDFIYKTVGEDATYTVCDQEGGIEKTESCQESQPIKGYDITEFGKNATPEQEVPTTVDFKIPIQSEDLEGSTDYTHHIKATGGASDKVTVKWKATITFVNYDFDQQYNTDKEFVATWVFTPVDCTSGQPVESLP